MAFADHLTLQRRTGGTRLLIDTHLDAMGPDEADAARTLLGTLLSDAQVSEAFHSEGYRVSAAAVCNWRSANKAGRYAS